MYICAVCDKEFTHTKNLKIHILKEHEKKDLQAKLIDPELVLAQPILKPKLKKDMTDLEELKEDRMVMKGVKVSGEIYKAVVKASFHCPKLFQLLVSGYHGIEWE